MRQRKRVTLWLVLSSIVGSLLAVVSTETASAAESIPELQWPAVKSSRYIWSTVTDPSGGVTNACTSDNSLVNLKTYDTSGQIIRELDASETIDGRRNCISYPVIDKNGDLYGKPDQGPILTAYSGNTLKWKYDTGCSFTLPVVGADDNIYVISNTNGYSLVGLTPDVRPPLTGPAKVLDVPLIGTSLCSASLQATKYGIAYLKDMRAYFYTYGGKLLGSTPSGYYIDKMEQINANGRAFYPIYLGSGSTASIAIVAYDLLRGAIEWTAAGSLFGENPQFVDASSTPDGGVVVRINRLKDVGGIERVNALVKLNAAGGKVWEQDLPNQDTAGNAWSTTRVVVDTNGNIVVTRDGSMETNDPYNGYTPAISFGVFTNGGDGNGHGQVEYATIMRGNLDKASGPVYGYSIGGQGYNGPTPGLDTLYFLGTCEESCSVYLETKLYAIKIPGLGLDYPRGAVLTANTGPQPAPVPYVALGDSYSSGEGVSPFESSSACHRSVSAYSQVLSHDPSMAADLNLGGFWACSGAKTENIKDTSFNGEAAQSTRLDSSTKLVTISIGGNDMGFTPFGIACVFDTCAQGTTAYNTAMNNLQTVVPDALTSTYVQLLEAAKNAKIYVVDYPQVAPADKQYGDPRDPRCSWLADLDQFGVPTWADAQAAREIVTQLDNTIRDAVADVRAIKPDYATRLQYVPVNNPGSPFAGHTMCADPGESYFNNLDTVIGHESWVLHPNERGQQAYAQILKEAMNQ